MEWRHSGSPRPKKIPSAKIRFKSSRLEFFGTKTAFSSLIFFQRAKLSTRSVPHLGRFLVRQCLGSPGTCNPEQTDLPGLLMSSSPTLFPGSGPIGLPPVPWTKKTIEMSPFLSDAEVIAAADTWLDGQHSELF